MTAVLIHGVPETAELWDDLRAELSGVETTALSLPGFAAPVPDGFEATKEGYLTWLTGELERFDEPVDLVGHDWGGILAVRLAMTRPELVRTWATDAIAIFDPAARWHDLAQVWQTPGAGEEFMANLEGQSAQERAALLTEAGMPEAYASRAAQSIAPTMNRCILELYRSATDVHGDWGADLGTTERPGLAVVATDDPFSAGEQASEVAERLGLEVRTLDGLGHWWVVQDPARGAKLLRDFWSDSS